MPIDPALLDLMNQTITVAPLASVDAYGEETYGAPVTYRAYIQETPAQVLNQYGEEVTSSHTVYVNSTSRIEPTAQVTLPGNLQPYLVRVSVLYDELGIHHNVLHFGSQASG